MKTAHNTHLFCPLKRVACLDVICPLGSSWMQSETCVYLKEANAATAWKKTWERSEVRVDAFSVLRRDELRSALHQKSEESHRDCMHLASAAWVVAFSGPLMVLRHGNGLKSSKQQILWSKMVKCLWVFRTWICWFFGSADRRCNHSL